MGRTDGQTHRINWMHALIKFPEYIPYDLELWPGHEVGRMDGQTDGRTGVILNALLLFFE